MTPSGDDTVDEEDDHVGSGEEPDHNIGDDRTPEAGSKEPPPQESPAAAPAEKSSGATQIVTRRRLLAAGGGSALALLGGAGYVYQALQGEPTPHVAPDDFPVLSTRGSFENGTATSQLEPEAAGDWPSLQGDAPLVIFVHGLGTEHDDAMNQAYSAQRGFEAAGRELPVSLYSWDSDRDWGVANQIAEQNGRALARRLAALPPDSRPIHLLGYSLGARVSCVCLQELFERNRMDAIASVSLIGGAIPHESVEEREQYGVAVATAPQVVNFHSENDRVLAWLYRLAEQTRAVGHGGARNPEATPATYEDVDVTDLVDDHGGYYRPATGCIDRIVDTVF